MMRKFLGLACVAAVSTNALQGSKSVEAKGKPVKEKDGEGRETDGKENKGKKPGDKVEEADKADEEEEEEKTGEETDKEDTAKPGEKPGKDGAKDRAGKKPDKADDKAGADTKDKPVEYAAENLFTVFLTENPFARFMIGAASLLDVIEGKTKADETKVKAYMKDLKREDLAKKIVGAGKASYMTLVDDVKKIPALGEDVEKIDKKDIDACVSALKAIGKEEMPQLETKDNSLPAAATEAVDGGKKKQVDLCKKISKAFEPFTATGEALIKHPDGGSYTKEQLTEMYKSHAEAVEEFKKIDMDWKVQTVETCLKWWVWLLIGLGVVAVLVVIVLLIACMMMTGDETKEIDEDNFEDEEAEETEGLDEE